MWGGRLRRLIFLRSLDSWASGKYALAVISLQSKPMRVVSVKAPIGSSVHLVWSGTTYKDTSVIYTPGMFSSRPNVISCANITSSGTSTTVKRASGGRPSFVVWPMRVFDSSEPSGASGLIERVPSGRLV